MYNIRVISAAMGITPPPPPHCKDYFLEYLGREKCVACTYELHVFTALLYAVEYLRYQVSK